MKIGRMAALAALCLFAGRAMADLKSPLAEQDTTLNQIKAFMDQAAFKTEIDEDGDLKITDDGLKSFFRVDAERKIITIFAVYRLKASATELQKLQLINRLNDKVIVVRFCMPDATTLWCDYQFSFDGGVTPFYILNTYRQFARITRMSVATHDTEDVVGSD
jgi:hypothetical protein